MEASTRLLLGLTSRHLLSFSPLRNPNPRFPKFAKLPSYPRNAAAIRRHLNPFLSLSYSRIQRPDLDSDARSSDLARAPSDWGGLGLGFGGGEKKGAIWTVVLLGWLGAEEKHMKRYAEVYTAMGMRAMGFVVPVRETVGLDLCKNVEDRVRGLAEEVDRLCKEEEEDGRERCLVFHTFSNTGWLV